MCVAKTTKMHGRISLLFCRLPAEESNVVCTCRTDPSPLATIVMPPCFCFPIPNFGVLRRHCGRTNRRVYRGYYIEVFVFALPRKFFNAMGMLTNSGSTKGGGAATQGRHWDKNGRVIESVHGGSCNLVAIQWDDLFTIYSSMFS